MKMAGWKEVPVDTTTGRIIKLAIQGDIVELTVANPSIQGKGMGARDTFGEKLRSTLSDT